MLLQSQGGHAEICVEGIKEGKYSRTYYHLVSKNKNKASLYFGGWGDVRVDQGGDEWDVIKIKKDEDIYYNKKR